MPILENNTLWIKDCRLSFPAVIQPKPVQNGPPKYSCNLILQESQPEWAEAKQIVGQMAMEKWEDKAQAVLNMVQNDKRLRCYGVGVEKTNAQTGEVYDGFKDPGAVWISANNDNQPQLYGTNAQPLPPTANANQLFVGGNYVAAVVRFWPQENEHGRAIRCQLVGLQYLREGEHFGAEEIDAGGVFQPAPGAPAPTGVTPGMPAPTPGMPAPTPGMPAPTPGPAPAPAAPAAPAPAQKPDFL